MLSNYSASTKRERENDVEIETSDLLEKILARENMTIAMKRVVKDNKIYEPTFSKSSYGFRPGRSQHMVIKQAKEYINQGYKWVVDMDLEKFFDTVQHDILMNKLSKKIEDKRVLNLHY